MNVYEQDSVLEITPESAIQAAREAARLIKRRELTLSPRLAAAWKCVFPDRNVPLSMDNLLLEERYLIGLVLLVLVAGTEGKVALVRDPTRYLHHGLTELFLLLSADCRLWIVPPITDAIIQ